MYIILTYRFSCPDELGHADRQAFMGPLELQDCLYHCQKASLKLKDTQHDVDTNSANQSDMSNQQEAPQPKNLVRRAKVDPEISSHGQIHDGFLATFSAKDDDGNGAGSDSYTLYKGNGSNFPKQSEWVSFAEMYLPPDQPTIPTSKTQKQR